MTFLLSLLTPRAGLYAALGAAVVGAALWLRYDAVQDDREADRLKHLEHRIETKERRDAIDRQIRALTDCELRRDGIVRLSGDADAAGRAFQRCVKAAAENQTGDGGIPGGQ